MKNKLNKIDNKLNKTLDNIKKQESLLFGRNSHYIHEKFKKDPEIIKRLKGKNLNDCISFFNLYAKKFKNLNFLNNNTEQTEYQQYDNDNKAIIHIVSNILDYVNEEFNINNSMFKSFLGINSLKDKIINLKEKGIINIDSNEFINNFINFDYSKDPILIVENTRDLINDVKKEIKKELANKGYINIVEDSLSGKTNINLNKNFINDILDNKYDIKYIYEILSIVDEIDDVYLEKDGKDTFFYKKGFHSNDPYNLVYEGLGSSLQKIKCFDNFIYGYTPYGKDIIKKELDGRIGGYRNNKIYIPAGSLDLIEEKNGKINPYIGMFFNFKGIKYREMGEFDNKNRLIKMLNEGMSYKFINDLFHDKVLFNIKDIKKYQSNINFYHKDFYHTNKDFQKKVELKFKNNERIHLKEFLYYCNYNLEKDKTNHEINFLHGDFKDLKEQISKFKNIIIADFETTGLNEFYNSDILTFSYKIIDQNGKFIKEKTYYIDSYKENITEGAKGSFDVDDYEKNEKISREDFIKGIKTLFKKENLFVFHNGYNFDINILKSNFNDLGESIKDLNTLDTMILFREKYISKKNKDFNIYSYSMDNLSKKESIKNERDQNNHLSEEDVNILTDLFLDGINKF